MLLAQRKFEKKREVRREADRQYRKSDRNIRMGNWEEGKKDEPY